MQFYSQHGEDRFLYENNLLPEKGVFVDVGAEDGVTGSNTYMLEGMGWTGLCVEANPLVMPLLRRTRKCSIACCAIGSKQRLFHIHPNKGWSGFLQQGDDSLHCVVETRWLDDVLDEFGIKKIDLLSVDTEGTEIEVLDTVPLDIYRPKIVVAEWNTWDGKLNTTDALKRYFAPYPYRLVHQTESNLIFQRTE